MKAWKSIHISSKSLLDKTLKGISQIMLQENKLTGLIFLIGVFIGSIEMGIALIFSTVIGTATAIFLNFSSANISRGIYGFSAALVGAGLLTFLQDHWLTWFLMLIGAITAPILQEFASKRKIPIFTLPFVLILWSLLFLAKKFEIPEAVTAHIVIPENESYLYFIRGFGQVIFQYKLIPGILFFLGLFISNRIAAITALVMSILAGGMIYLYGLIAIPFGADLNRLSLGLFSFNAVLTAIVFAGPTLKHWLWSFFSVSISLVITLIFLYMGWMQLTFPFVVAAIATLLIKNKGKFT